MFAFTKLMQAMVASGTVSDPYFYLTTLLLNTNTTNGAQNNTFLDSSSNNFSITRNGNTTQGTFTPFSQTGWSNFFGGTGSYASTANTLIATTTSTFTIEGWIYPTATPVTTSGIPSTVADCQPTGLQLYWSFGPLANGTLSFYWYDGGAKSAVGNTTIALNTWTHIAVSVNANAITLYVNGTQQTITGTTTLTNRAGSTANCAFSQFSNGGSYFAGYISNFSILSGTAKYSTSFTPSTTPLATGTTNQVLLFAAGNRFADFNTAITAKTFTITGTPSVQAFSPFAPTAAYDAAVVGGSGYFDGTGDYLVFGSGQANANLNGNCSIELWFYPTGAAAAGLLTAKYGGTTNQFYVNSQSNNLIYCEFLGSTFYAKTSSGSFTRNAWNHLLITKSSTTAKMWLNGVYEGSWTVSTTNSSTDAIGVGATQGGATTFNGYISGIRYSNTATETGTSNITLPTAPLTSNGNTAALLSFTNAGIFDAAAKNDLETVGNAQVSTTQAKFGTTSMYFDGSGDYLLFPSSPNLAFGTGDYTVEAWVYFTAISGAALQIIFRSGGGGNNFYFHADDNQLSVGTGGAFISIQATTFATNTWYHVAACRSGTTLRLFRDGTQIGSSVTDSTNWVSTGTAGVGSNETGIQTFSGYIDDLRVSRYARYTANFTAPTAAFPTQ